MSGGILLGGCSPSELGFFYSVLYEIGTVLYDKKKAAKGIVEKVFIKDIRYIHEGKANDPFRKKYIKRLINYPPLYIDGFNAYFNEEDLCEQEEAEELITNYRIAYAAEIERLAREC